MALRPSELEAAGGQEVAGSNPVAPTEKIPMKSWVFLFFLGEVQLAGKMPGLGRGYVIRDLACRDNVNPSSGRLAVRQCNHQRSANCKLPLSRRNFCINVGTASPRR
jgi:hypothetical protein